MEILSSWLCGGVDFLKLIDEYIVSDILLRLHHASVSIRSLMVCIPVPAESTESELTESNRPDLGAKIVDSCGLGRSGPADDPCPSTLNFSS